MGAIIVSALSGFATYLIGSMVARVASLVAFTTIATPLLTGLLDQAVESIGSANAEMIWFLSLSGFDVGLSAIGGALLLRASINAFSIKPGAMITGGAK